MRQHVTSVSVRAAGLLGVVLSLAACGGPAASVAPRLAQRQGRGGAVTCNQDSDCHTRLPAARACPNGGQSVPTACCRMNYCGICWSDCPPAGSRATDGAGDAPTVAM